MKNKWIIVPIILVPLVFILGGLTKIRSKTERYQIETKVEETSTKHENPEQDYIKAIDYELNKNNVKGAIIFTDRYENDWPESKEKIIEIKKEIENKKVEMEKAYEVSVKNVWSKKDEVRDEEYVYSKYDKNMIGYNLIIPYAVRTHSLTLARFRLQYHSDNWIFFQKIILKIDDEYIEIPFEKEDKQEDTIRGNGVAEWITIPMTDEIKSVLFKVSKSKIAILRLEGRQYYDDREITENEKKGIKDVLSVSDYETYVKE